MASTYCVAPAHGPNGGVADSLDEARPSQSAAGALCFDVLIGRNHM
jgi:hypothetical protein